MATVDDEQRVATTAAVFGRAAATYDSVIPFFATFGRRLVELAGVAEGEQVLDVASGRGASALVAAERVGPRGSVLGVDLAPEMVAALAGDLAGAGLTHAGACRMDARDLGLPDARYDVVLCGFALHLMPDPLGVLVGIHRVVRQGGRCAVSVPVNTGTHWNFFSDLVTQFLPRAVGPLPPPPGPPLELALLLSEAGFADVVQYEESGSFRLPDAETWWAWIWSQGMRGFLEALPADALAEFRQLAFDQLREMRRHDGIELVQPARYACGRRPA
jgi:O-methyltransferase/aklanonic acid methyltransferase